MVYRSWTRWEESLPKQRYILPPPAALYSSRSADSHARVCQMPRQDHSTRHSVATGPASSDDPRIHPNQLQSQLPKWRWNVCSLSVFDSMFWLLKGIFWREKYFFLLLFCFCCFMRKVPQCVLGGMDCIDTNKFCVSNKKAHTKERIFAGECIEEWDELCNHRQWKP